MCGIAGYVDFKNGAERKVMRSTIAAVRHRGPDSSGIFLDRHVGLGIQRLRIIDLVTGDQPIISENGRFVVVFNGEIYNYLELREELLEKGHKFRTRSDTEVLVHLYEEYGTEMARRLNGMFAFVIWDGKRECLFLARDQAGIKPLYFSRSLDGVIFGSEIKAVLRHPKIKKVVNREAVNAYFGLGYIPGKQTIFQGIHKLEPGTGVLVSKKGWQATKFAYELSGSGGDLDSLLAKAVAREAVSDVPLGIFLSGGIDSSLLAYYLVKARKRVKSFSIAFAESEVDETKYARQVARFLGIKHESYGFSGSDLVKIFPEVTAKLDEPLADPSLFPTYMLCRQARRQVTVALSGDGGDEVFGGYPTVQGELFARYFGILPAWLNQGFSKLSFASPFSFGQYSKRETYEVFFQGLRYPKHLRNLYWTSRLDGRLPERALSFLSVSPWYLGLTEQIEKSELSSEQKIQMLLFLTYLRDDLLVKTDRASMFNSLEVRVPYLDPELVAFAFRQGGHVDWFKTKKQLRKLARGKLPVEIVNRKKKGFGIPLLAWLRAPLSELAHDYLKNGKLFDFVDRAEVAREVQDFYTSRIDNSRYLWALVMFSGWLDCWTKN